MHNPCWGMAAARRSHQIHHLFHGIDGPHLFYFSSGPDGIVNLRPVALRELKVDPHFFQGQQDIGKDYGGIEFEAADGLQRYFHH